jgi:hypothetical protein
MPFVKGVTPKGAKPFQKGNPGGPGKPKLPDLKEALARSLGEQAKDGTTALDQIIEALRRKAAQGDVKAAELLLARGFGKPRESVDITSGGEKIAAPPIVWVDAKEAE